MHAAFDPIVLRVPGDFDAWSGEVETWEALLDASPFSASWPQKAREAVYGHWANYDWIVTALRNQDSALGYPDVIRLLELLVSRLDLDPLPAGYDAIVDDPGCSPAYEPDVFDEDVHAAMTAFLARVGLRRHLTGEPVGFVTQSESGTVEHAAVVIEGSIALLEEPDRDVDTPDVRAAALREHLRVLLSPRDVMEALAERPCALLAHLPFGVRVHRVGAMGLEDEDLQITLGPHFLESIARMNYRRDERRARALLRVMALIASGQAAYVPGHRERAGSGPNNRIVVDAEGFEVERTYLAQRSPNAHRLFWSRRPTPHFLNVGGHDAGPSL